MSEALDWKSQVRTLLESGCTDSDIEDYVEEHPELNGKEIWDYVYELDAPTECKGCRNIQMSGMYPCNICSRRTKLKDFYQPR